MAKLRGGTRVYGTLSADTSAGIGTTSIGATLHVVASSSSIAGLFTGTTSSDMVRITQTGTGNALVVEDSANPDTTPFVVNTSGDVGIGTTNPTSYLTLGAGTATAGDAPLKFIRGTVLSGIESGSIEYDGTTLYATPNTNYGRASIPTTVYTSGSGTAGIAASTNYALFPGSNNSLTLLVGTYSARASFRIAVTGSTVSSACTFNILGGGTAAGTFSWRGIGATTDAGPGICTAIPATTLSAGPLFTVTASTNANPRQYIVIGEGILRITTSGSINPSYSWSAALTGGTTTLVTDNHLIIQTLDSSGTSVSTGGWA